MTGETDPCCRKPFPWEEEEKWNKDLFELYKALSSIRSESEALKKGSINFIYNKAGVLGFEREYEGETILVFTNSRSKAFDIELELDGVYEDVFSGKFLDNIGTVKGKGYLILKELN
jgi:alpha-glucosidase